MLISQSWSLLCDPPRDVAYERTSRFIQHCEKLGVSYAYTLNDLYKADQRWQKLHENAVPSLMEFQDRTDHIKECKHIKNLSFATSKLQEESDFGF